MLKKEEIHWVLHHWNKTSGSERERYAAWLFIERDELSFQNAGDLLFPLDKVPDGRKAKARRRWAKIEWEFFGRDRLGQKRKRKGKPKPIGVTGSICPECGRGPIEASFGLGMAWFSSPTPR